VLLDDPVARPYRAIWLVRCRHLSFAATRRLHHRRCRRIC
jgi:hypothetical protein